MLRHSILSLGVASSVSLVLKRQKSHCNDAAPSHPVWPFETKGLPTEVTPVIPNVANVHPLLLSGVGMRRKNLYIVEVDIYLLGLNLSTAALTKGKDWSKTENKTTTLSDALLEKTPLQLPTKTKKATTSHNDVRIALTLRFVRGVTKTQFLDAFNDAFAGCNQANVDTFKNSLGKIVDDSGVKQGEEIYFYWLDNGDFTVSRNGVMGDTFNINEINHRLLEVYIDPKRTVCPELSKSIHDFLKSVEF